MKGSLLFGCPLKDVFCGHTAHWSTSTVTLPFSPAFPASNGDNETMKGHVILTGHAGKLSLFSCLFWGATLIRVPFLSDISP